MDAVFLPMYSVDRSRSDDDDSIEKLKKLKGEGFNMNMKDGEGFTALMEASILGREKIVEYLLSIGVDVNLTNYYDGSALTSVCSREFGVIGNTNIVKMLLAAGANPNQRLDDGRGRDSIMLSVINQNSEIVKLLIEAGADLTHRDLYGKTAMDYAKEGSDETIIQVLTDAIKRD